MGIDDVETFATWTYDPSNDTFRIAGASPESALGLFELSSGRATTSGGRVIDRQSGRIIGNIATTTQAFLEVGSKGTIFLSNVRPPRYLVEAMGSDRLPRAIIQGDLTLLGDTSDSPINRTITLAPRNAFIYVNDAVPRGKGRYTRVDAGIFGGAPPPRTNEFGHLATSEDLIKRGVAGWVARNAEAAMEKLKLEGVELEDGSISTSGSDIINALAAAISVTPIVTYILQEAFIA